MKVHLNSVPGNSKDKLLQGQRQARLCAQLNILQSNVSRRSWRNLHLSPVSIPLVTSLHPLGCDVQCLTCLSRKTASLHLSPLTLQGLLDVVWRTSHPMHVCCHHMSSLCAVPVPLSTVSAHCLCLDIFQLISILTCHPWQLAFMTVFPRTVSVCFTELRPYCQGQISYEVKFLNE